MNYDSSNKNRLGRIRYSESESKKMENVSTEKTLSRRTFFHAIIKAWKNP